jgi:hypothetical protein
MEQSVTLIADLRSASEESLVGFECKRFFTSLRSVQNDRV